jgi:hypothetical protein
MALQCALRRSLESFLTLVACFTWVQLSFGDETPPKETAQHSKPEKNELLSFSKYENRLKQICTEMESDGRRERLAEVAAKEAKAIDSCPSCRALWRSIDRSCRKPVKIERPVRKKSAPKEGEEAALAEETPTPTPTPVPHRERYPSPAVLDLVSRLSDSLFEADQAGGVRKAVDYVKNVLLATNDLNPGEKDYFEIFTAYLLAAWQGRAAAHPTPAHSPGELDELFK